MLPDAIDINNRVAKLSKKLLIPKTSSVEFFSQLDKKPTVNHLSFKSLANIQSEKATDFNKAKPITPAPIDVPTLTDVPKKINSPKLKKDFFEKMWDKHSYHILGSLDANPGGKIAKLGVGLFTLSSIRKVSTPFFKTTSEATAAAKSMGYQKINETVHEGQAVYNKGKKYITRDLDGHNGGAWKMAKSVKKLEAKEIRDGTFNFDLSKRIGE